LLKLKDFYHSPGYQIYLRLLFAALNSPNAVIHASKLLSLLMFIGSALLVYRLGRRWFPPGVAQIATALFLCSESWRYYCNMIQYEVLTGFLMLLFLSMLVSSESSSSTGISELYGIGIGLVIAVISLIQIRYLVLLLIPLTYTTLIQRNRSIRNLRENALIPFISLGSLALWSIWQSSDRGGGPVLMEGSGFRFHVANNPNALGYSFPYPHVSEPSGWHFILSMPGRWVWLIGQRSLYLLGIKRDIWALPPEGFGSGRIGSYSFLDVTNVVLFASGLIVALAQLRHKQLNSQVSASILLLAGVVFPPLFIFGSKRFIIPIIPLISLFQAYAIVFTARTLLGPASVPNWLGFLGREG